MAARKSKAKLFAIIKRRSNQHGSFFNCCFVEGLESIPSLEAMEAALNTERGKNAPPVELRARGDGQIDSSNRVWIDLYPRTVNPFKLAAERAEVQS